MTFEKGIEILRQRSYSQPEVAPQDDVSLRHPASSQDQSQMSEAVPDQFMALSYENSV